MPALSSAMVPLVYSTKVRHFHQGTNVKHWWHGHSKPWKVSLILAWCDSGSANSHRRNVCLTQQSPLSLAKWYRLIQLHAFHMSNLLTVHFKVRNEGKQVLSLETAGKMNIHWCTPRLVTLSLIAESEPIQHDTLLSYSIIWKWLEFPIDLVSLLVR